MAKVKSAGPPHREKGGNVTSEVQNAAAKMTANFLISYVTLRRTNQRPGARDAWIATERDECISKVGKRQKITLGAPAEEKGERVTTVARLKHPPRKYLVAELVHRVRSCPTLLFGCIACKPSSRGFLPSRLHRTKPGRNSIVSRPWRQARQRDRALSPGAHPQWNRDTIARFAGSGLLGVAGDPIFMADSELF